MKLNNFSFKFLFLSLWHNVLLFFLILLYIIATEKTAKSILISCGARLAPFYIGEFKELMSERDIKLMVKEIGEKYGIDIQSTEGNSYF